MEPCIELFYWQIGGFISISKKFYSLRILDLVQLNSIPVVLKK